MAKKWRLSKTSLVFAFLNILGVACGVISITNYAFINFRFLFPYFVVEEIANLSMLEYQCENRCPMVCYPFFCVYVCVRVFYLIFVCKIFQKFSSVFFIFERAKELLFFFFFCECDLKKLFLSFNPKCPNGKHLCNVLFC